MECGSIRSLLLTLAQTGEHRLEPEREPDFQHLIQNGLIAPAAPPRHLGLEKRYEELQDRHARILEAKSLLNRLAQRTSGPTGLGRWLSSTRPPGPDDPDVVQLYRLIVQMELEIRDVTQAEDLLGKFKHLQEHLHVEGRECLDHMAGIDKELASQKKAPLLLIQVEPLGWFQLTPEGEKELPEFLALQELDRVFNLVSGPRQQKIDDYQLFRQDPASLLAIVMENPAGGENQSDSITAFEELAERIRRQSHQLGISSPRILNAFMFRLLRLYRTNPRTLTVWGNKEKLQTFLDQAKPYLPKTLVGEGWPLVYGMDIMLAGWQESGPEGRRWLLETILAELSRTFPELEARQGHGIRLAVAMLHALLDRRLSTPMMVERFLSVMMAALKEGRQAIPDGLPGEGAKLIFGYHLAHLSEFLPARIPDLVSKYRRIETLFGDREGGLNARQVNLHTLCTLERLERLERLGRPVTPQEYLGTYQRVRTWIRQHKALPRSLSNEFSQPEDLPFLIANLTARAFFTGPVQIQGKPLPDVGVASAYESPEHTSAPMLGLPFGTLML